MNINLIDRYIATTVLKAIGLITLALAGLQIFILFVSQFNDLGRGNFGAVQAVTYVFLQVPYQVYLFFPMASLLGCLIGIGIMANNRELIVMRAAGLSVSGIAISVMKVALFIILIVTIIGETIAPQLTYFAEKQRMDALSKGQAYRTVHGLWLRRGNDFIHINEILAENKLRNIDQFRFDSTHHLRLVRKIEQLNFSNGQWQAFNAAETIIESDHTTARLIDNMNWDVKVDPLMLGIISREPDEMTLAELKRYIKNQQTNQQMSLNYQVVFWQRIIQPLTTMVMMLLAIPFIFGPLRSSTLGSKLLVGTIVGFSFNIANRFFAPVSQVLHWPPLLAALLPTVLFALLGIYLMHRVK